MGFTGRAAALLHTGSVGDDSWGSSWVCLCLLYSLDQLTEGGEETGGKGQNAGRWQIPNLILFLQVLGGSTILRISGARVQ